MPTCHSTNDIASDLISKKGVHDGTVVITDHQTAGKGQRGNTWEAEPGKNLTFSIILRPHFLDISEQYFLNIIISISINDLFRQYVPDGLTIKWPNDIYYTDKKLGGILIESSIKNNLIEHVVAGIGLNINQVNFSNPNAISLSNICNQEFDKEEILSLLLKNIEVRYLQLKKRDFDGLRKEYHRNLYWVNEKHLFKADTVFEGEIKGIDERGRLVILHEGWVRYYSNKEINFIR